MKRIPIGMSLAAWTIIACVALQFSCSKEGKKKLMVAIEMKEVK